MEKVELGEKLPIEPVLWDVEANHEQFITVLGKWTGKGGPLEDASRDSYIRVATALDPESHEALGAIAIRQLGHAYIIEDYIGDSDNSPDTCSQLLQFVVGEIAKISSASSLRSTPSDSGITSELLLKNGFSPQRSGGYIKIVEKGY